jgi:hypothetical protein
MADVPTKLDINGDVVELAADPGVDISKCLGAKVWRRKPTTLFIQRIDNPATPPQMFTDWLSTVDPKFLVTKLTFQVGGIFRPHVVSSC